MYNNCRYHVCKGWVNLIKAFINKLLCHAECTAYKKENGVYNIGQKVS